MSWFFYAIGWLFDLLGELQKISTERQFDRLIAMLLHLFASALAGLFVGWIVAAFTSDALGVYAGLLGAFLYGLCVGSMIFRRKRRRPA